MAKVFRMSVYDLNNKKLCSLYDSDVAQDGAAYGIKVKKEIGGWKEISFNLSKYNQKGEYNFRCDYIKNEQHLKVEEGDEEDLYCIKAPETMHDKSKVQFTVSCNHISEELKTKNLFKYFDDTNGIGTCEELIAKALRGSGWKLVACDKFLESDGTTEKIRSYSCETKTGAWNMISEICELFDARPVFHGASKTIEIHASSNTNGWMEILFGKNASKIKRRPDSDKIATRLYVEGEYGDYGYVGIDDVNPTGLPFILNFDYYKDIGMFTDEHQQIVDKYIFDYKKASDDIKAVSAEWLGKYAELTELVGNMGQVYYPIFEDKIDKNNMIAGESVSKEKRELKSGDTIYVVDIDGSYEKIKYSSDISVAGKLCIIKFVPAATGILAAYEDIIKASERAIESYLEKLNYYLRKGNQDEVTVEDLKRIYNTDDLSTVKDENFNLTGVAEQYKQENILEYTVSIGNEEKSISETEKKLNEGMLTAIELMLAIDALDKDMESATVVQEDVEEVFVEAIGSMLRDGYWSDSNYTIGQEQSLYNDAIEISKKLAYPTISQTIETHDLSIQDKYAGEEFKLAQTIRIYDPEIKLNDCGIVSEVTIYPDKPTSNSIAIKTDLLDIGTKSFATILERVTSLAEQVRRNKDKYERASAISKDGTIHSDMLEGAIDVMKTQLLSNASNWKTDEKGNIIFTTLDGKCAMMLCGSGFMIANSKLENGDWNWRTFGTGNGFAADLITTGYLSSARIDTDELIAKEGFIDKISTQLIESSELGSSIELTNKKIDMIVSSDDSESQFVLTDFMVSLITSEVEIAVNKIDISANESIQVAIRNEVENKASSLEMTTQKFETFVQNSDGISKIEQKADKIDLLIEGESTETNVVLTESTIEAISENIDVHANKEFKLIIGDMDSSIKANKEAIEANADAIELNAEQIKMKASQATVDDLTGIVSETQSRIEIQGDAITLIAGEVKNFKPGAQIFRQETFPTDIKIIKPNDVLIVPSTGETYQAEDASGYGLRFYLMPDGSLQYELDVDDETIKLEMDNYDLNTNGIIFTNDEEGNTVPVIRWVLVRDDGMMSKEEFQHYVRVEDDGLHVGAEGSTGEVVIDHDSVDVVLGGRAFSSFAANYVEFGNYQLRRTADGGLAFKMR